MANVSGFINNGTIVNGIAGNTFTATNSVSGAVLSVDNGGNIGTIGTVYAASLTATASVSALSGFKTGSSTYGPTSATIYGAVTTSGSVSALSTLNWSGGQLSNSGNRLSIIPNATTAVSGGYIANAANNSAIILWDNLGNLNALSFNTGSSTYGPTSATVNGNVGIGTSSPSYPIDISSVTYYPQLRISSSGSEAGLMLNSTSSGGRQYGLISGGSGGSFAGGSFGLYDNTATAVRFYVDSSGITHFNNNVYSSGLFVSTGTGSYSGLTYANNGDVVAQRNSTQGFLWLGGSSNSLSLDFNSTNANALAILRTGVGPADVYLGNLNIQGKLNWAAGTGSSGVDFMQWVGANGITNVTMSLNSGSGVSGVYPTAWGNYAGSWITAVDLSGNVGIAGTMHAGNALITSLNAGSSGFPAGSTSYAGLAWNGSNGYAEATIFTSNSSVGRTASFWYWNGSSYSQSSYIQTNGTYTSTSDKTLKENIQPLAMGLKEVMLLKPSSFTWKNNGKADHGFIAQDVQEVIPAAVEPMYAKDGEPDTNGILGLSYSHIIPVLVNAIQELKAELDILKAAKNATA
jgi:Chaperone of endosialidase